MFSNQINHLKAIKSFTVIEVLIAMVVIVLTLSAAIMTTRSSFTSDQDSLDYGIAKNLAKEGLEMAKNVIDTNILKYSAYKDDCWNYWLQKDQAVNADARCAGSSEPTITDGYYTVYIDVDGANPNPDGYDMAIKLKGNDDAIPVPYSSILGNEDKFRLSKVQISVAGSVNLYANYDNMASDQITYTFDPTTGQTKFYRSIYLTYDPIPNALVIASKVWWQSRGREAKFQVKTKLYNYFD